MPGTSGLCVTMDRVQYNRRFGELFSRDPIGEREVDHL